MVSLSLIALLGDAKSKTSPHKSNDPERWLRMRLRNELLPEGPKSSIFLAKNAAILKQHITYRLRKALSKQQRVIVHQPEEWEYTIASAYGWSAPKPIYKAGRNRQWDPTELSKFLRVSRTLDTLEQVINAYINKLLYELTELDSEFNINGNFLKQHNLMFHQIKEVWDNLERVLPRNKLRQPLPTGLISYEKLINSIQQQSNEYCDYDPGY